MTSYSDDGKTQLVRGVFEELVQRMEQVGGAIHPEKVRAGSAYAGFFVKGHDHVTPFDPEAVKLVAAVDDGGKVCSKCFSIRSLWIRWSRMTESKVR